MSNISPTSGGSQIPPESNKVEGKKGQAGPQPQNTLQAEILQIEALLQSGDKSGAIQELNNLLGQLGPGTLPNAARNELLAAKSAIQGGAAPSVINSLLNTAFNLLGQQNTYQSQIQQIMANLNEGNRTQALSEINSLMNMVQSSGGAPSIINGILYNLAAARSEIQGGAAPSTIMPNLTQTYDLLASLPD